MEQKQSLHFAFGRRNYRLMFVGIAVLAAGFITMTLDSSDYGEGFLGITLGPLLLLAGFGVEFWAIMARPETLPNISIEAAAPASAAAPAPSQPTTAPVAAGRPTYKRS